METIRPGQRLDRYVCEAHIGRGTAANVYRVRHIALNTVHAIKVPHAQQRSLMDRAVQEGLIQASFSHPYLVPVTDMFRLDDGTPVLVMDFVAGPNLKELLRRGRLSLTQTDAVLTPALEGLAMLHRAGIVHRDVKPSNIMVSERLGHVWARITDFGLAKDLWALTPSRITMDGAALGNPRYMSIEQLRSTRDVDVRADVHSMGVTIYEMLTGKPAYDASSYFELCSRIGEGDHIPLGDRRPELPEAVIELVERCIHPDREQRPQDCQALQAAWAEVVPPGLSRAQASWDVGRLRMLRGQPHRSPQHRRHSDIELQVHTERQLSGQQPANQPPEPRGTRPKSSKTLVQRWFRPLRRQQHSSPSQH